MEEKLNVRTSSDLPENKPLQGLSIDKSGFIRTFRFVLFYV